MYAKLRITQLSKLLYSSSTVLTLWQRKPVDSVMSPRAGVDLLEHLVAISDTSAIRLPRSASDHKAT